MNSETRLATGSDRFADTRLFTPANRLFLLNDADSIRNNVSTVFKAHELRSARASQAISASMHHLRRGSLSLSRLEYGAQVIIDPGRLESFFLLQMPMRGSAEIHCEGQTFTSSPACASLISPDSPVQMRWAADSPQLTLRLERSDLERHCRQHLGHHLDRPLQFAPQMCLDTPGGSYFLQLLATLIEALSCDAHPIHQPLVLKQFESTLLNALIYGQPNNLRSLETPGDRRRVSPWFVKRTEEFIRAHAHEPLSIEQLADQAQVSVRSLFAGFREFTGTSPMAYLRDVRMERVHSELCANHEASVTDIAMKWGFAHLGRFSQEYRKRYGELPSATLRFSAQ
ncbi:AraC family transcriptional regulator [Pseudomonas sp. 21LCFQ010]|uniref:AraC family transcriptional regulator n=1 Tax=Pseudomonas sp. 21LCFQ010 TaxID=2957506 RepID=UPI002096BB58|nr:AraC family transcriptional regulator [Pseudomonas sp. 21LCFQ010]MCO8161882.1 AraC family transcriptional regulator [Pseudomonas sp. 21LCFQ010]